MKKIDPALVIGGIGVACLVFGSITADVINNFYPNMIILWIIPVLGFILFVSCPVFAKKEGGTQGSLCRTGGAGNMIHIDKQPLSRVVIRTGKEPANTGRRAKKVDCEVKDS